MKTETKNNGLFDYTLVTSDANKVLLEIGSTFSYGDNIALGYDAYQKGAKVTYNGKTYVSTADNNVWAPGVFGWDLVK